MSDAFPLAAGPLDGDAMYALAAELFPICRSITGNGVRQTLRRLAEIVPLSISEVPTGTAALDWIVPPEWNVRDAWIATTDGRRVVDIRNSTLHLVSYSQPIRARVTREVLQAHLHSLPSQPDWIPYRTSYYHSTWGFCVTDRERQRLTDGEYDVVIDSTLGPGHLTYGECVVPGASPDTCLLSAHVCHPSLANDNLSGIVVLAGVIRWLLQRERHFTYRVLFAPGTIGALTWLASHEDLTPRVRHGLVVSCLGNAGGFTYKRSRRGNAEIDRVFALLARDSGPCELRDFSPDGYDERQYCSPGFDLPVGRLTRTPNGEYPEYHTSADNLDLIRAASLQASVDFMTEAITVIEGNGTYTNLLPKGEPQLGRRGLYAQLGGGADVNDVQRALLWVLNLSDGGYDLMEIADRSRLPFGIIRRAADLLVEHQLIERTEGR